jgi:Protein of unknown function (DUF3300)
MDRQAATSRRFVATAALTAVLAMGAVPASGQVPVDESGNAYGSPTELGTDGASYDAPVPLGAAELEELVGPVALYPDDLLAIVLPASTYPLEIVQAARFLEQYEADSSLQPNEDWDESVVALLNYPEVLRMMNEDIDWTWKLGDAVVNQQPDVISAVEAFRDRAYAAGNLKSDQYQTVNNNDDGIIEIVPIDDEIIYVPYYEPERVVVRQVAPVYYYYPRPYPVYYYPYPVGYSFYSGYFWGVTTAYRIGWSDCDLHVQHYSYWGHPYFGHSYYGHYYRRPSVTVYNNWYVNNATHRAANRYRDGDYWRPRDTGGARPGYANERTRSYRTHDVARGDSTYSNSRNVTSRPATTRVSTDAVRTTNRNTRSGVTGQDREQPIHFRERPENTAVARQDSRSTARERNAGTVRESPRTTRAYSTAESRQGVGSSFVNQTVARAEPRATSRPAPRAGTAAEASIRTANATGRNVQSVSRESHQTATRRSSPANPRSDNTATVVRTTERAAPRQEARADSREARAPREESAGQGRNEARTENRVAQSSSRDAVQSRRARR